MAGSSTSRVYRWLVQRLGGDATLQGLPSAPVAPLAPLGSPMRLYPRQAPESVAAYPVLIMQTQAAVDTWGLNCHLPSPLLFTIHGVVPGNSDVPLWDVMDRVDALLTGDLRAASTDLILWGRRAEERDYTEVTPGGKTFAHKLAVYRLQVTPP